jgi:hypothetical protein
VWGQRTDSQAIVKRRFYEKVASSFLVLRFDFFLTGCAFDVVHVKQFPANLDSGQAPKNSCVLEKEVNVDLGTGYSRTLRPGTRWDYAGSILQGEVFKTKDQILTVEASHIHEAYIVVSSGKLVGFYLPVEKTFSPLSEPQELSMRNLTP